jgi:hypothetical protein
VILSQHKHTHEHTVPICAYSMLNTVRAEQQFYMVKKQSIKAQIEKLWVLVCYIT